jgi:hypothetical protein
MESAQIIIYNPIAIIFRSRASGGKTPFHRKQSEGKRSI